MGVHFKQADCIEGKRVDLRQAELIARYKPDLIFFELPARNGKPDTVFNKFAANRKPLRDLLAIKRNLLREARRFPYALSDVYVWDAIQNLWEEGRNTLVFNVDRPEDVRRAYFKRHGRVSYARAKRHWWFWAYLLVRESEMARHIKQVVELRGRRNIIAVVLLQSIHWNHVQFLMRNPSKKKIWDYYFGRFPDLTPAKLSALLRTHEQTLFRYWQVVDAAL